jgi:gentisate 1,2-dioxygenase
MTVTGSAQKVSQPAVKAAGPARVTAELQAARESFYSDLPKYQMGALWSVLADALTPEPNTRSVAHLWKWSDVRPRVMRAGDLVTAAEAERRVLMFLNPGLPKDQLKAVGTIYAGVQLLLPGEIARTHHHTPSAVRFIIEGKTAYTTVSGERTDMSRGDYVTTPNWTWHDHGNDSDAPMLWLDGLDLPLVTELDAVFFELFSEKGGTEVQPVVRPLDDSLFRWARNLRPTYQTHTSGFSPILNYRWEQCRSALNELRDDPASPFDGVVLEYINPLTGGPTLLTMSAYLQLLRRGEHTKAHRHTSSGVYHVAEGGGYSVIGGKRFAWQEGDTFVIPSWTWHEHASEGGEAVLFSFSDRPVLKSFGLIREAALESGGGHQE